MSTSITKSDRKDDTSTTETKPVVEDQNHLSSPQGRYVRVSQFSRKSKVDSTLLSIVFCLLLMFVFI